MFYWIDSELFFKIMFKSWMFGVLFWFPRDLLALEFLLIYTIPVFEEKFPSYETNF